MSHQDNIARRVTAANAAISMISEETQATRKCDGITSAEACRHAVLMSRVGDVSFAVMCGHTDLTTELLKVAAAALGWICEIERERAA